MSAPDDIQWEGVSSESGWVQAAGFDPNTQTLYIQFQGALVAYESSEEEFLDLVSAPSAGKWVWANVYDRPYTYAAFDAY